MTVTFLSSVRQGQRGWRGIKIVLQYLDVFAILLFAEENSGAMTPKVLSVTRAYLQRPFCLCPNLRYPAAQSQTESLLLCLSAACLLHESFWSGNWELGIEKCKF